MRIEISNMYGFNDKNDFHFDTEKRHSFIYGINGSGKSSIAKALTHFVNGRPYTKSFPFDSDEYNIEFTFEDMHLALSNQRSLSQNDVNIAKNIVFIFNKEYVKNNISLSKSTGGSIEVGSRLNEREKLINEKSKIISETVKSFKEKGKNIEGFPSKVGEFKKGVISDLYGKNEEKHEASLYSLNQTVELNDLKLNVLDFYSDNIEAIKKFDDEILRLSQEILDAINESLQTFNYRIDDNEDRLFYNSLIRFLRTKNVSELKCPVCLETVINVEDVLESIINVINTKITDAETAKIHNLCESINPQSYFGSICHAIVNKLLQSIYDHEMISRFHDEFVVFFTNYNQYIIKFLGIDYINDRLIESIESRNNIIVEINQENRNLRHHAFTDILDDTLKVLFPDGYLTSRIDIFDQNPGIRIDINQRSKEGMEIESLFSDILSESQKTKFSLAFYFAVVIYRTTIEQIIDSVLCVFDDPVDSYDSLSKHYISRTLYEFITNKGIFQTKYHLSNIHSLVLSHSVEYLRLYDSNLLDFEKEQCDYFVQSDTEIRTIRTNKIFVLQGDYNILETLVNQEHLSIKEFIAILPILRELCKTANNVINKNPLQVSNLFVSQLNEYISREVIHGFSRQVSLQEIVDVVGGYIDFNVSDNQTILSTQTFFESLKSIIQEVDIDTVEFYDSIILKNLYAIYIRAYYDYLLSEEIRTKVTRYSQKNIDEIQNSLRTMQDKIGCLYRYGDDESRELIQEAAKIKPMFNDFAHSAGIFLTPLLDVELSLLRELFHNVSSRIIR